MKGVIAALIVLVLGIAGFGGYYYYTTQVAAPADASAQESTDAAPQDGVQMGTKKVPKNEYDVQDMLQAAFERNEDTVGWLIVPNTDINDSVLQANDNRYYERRDEGRRESTFGCYFADYECPVGGRDVLAANTVIYGHSNIESNDSPDAQRFSQLFRFLQPEFAEKTPYVFLTTPDERLAWQIFAVFYTTTDFDYIRVHLSPAEALKLGQEAQALSVYDYGVTLTAEDKLLTLSTCSTKFGTDGNQRFVVMARLLPTGTAEQEKISVQKTEKYL